MSLARARLSLAPALSPNPSEMAFHPQPDFLSPISDICARSRAYNCVRAWISPESFASLIAFCVESIAS